MKPILDYTLTTAQQRVNFVSSLPEETLRDFPETLANYILHCTEEKPESAFSASLTKREAPLENPEQLLQLAQTNRYTKPKLKPLWELFPEEAKCAQQLKERATNPETPSAIAYKLRKWRLELFLDIGTISQIIRKALPIAPPTSPAPPIEIEDHIDLTNAFHIKQLVAHYSNLRQSDASKTFVEWFDRIVDNTPLKPWQRHLLAGRAENKPQPTLGVELAEQYGKIISPSYMSQTMRQIYTKIAEQAKIELQRHLYHEQKWAHIQCDECGKTRLFLEFSKTQRARSENGKYCTCRLCEEVKKK